MIDVLVTTCGKLHAFSRRITTNTERMYVRSATLTSQLLDAFLAHRSGQLSPVMTMLQSTVLLRLMKLYCSIVERLHHGQSIIVPLYPTLWQAQLLSGSPRNIVASKQRNSIPIPLQPTTKQWTLPPNLSPASLTNRSSPSS